MVYWRREAFLYLHSAISETYLVQWYYIDLWSIGAGRPWYICILLYLKLISCSGISQIHGQLEEGALVYLHSSISETYLVQWYYIDLWSIGGEESWYMCILLYVKLTSCCAIPQIYGQQGVHLPWVYEHSSIHENYLVYWYSHGSMVNLMRGALVYLHSSICETYLVQWYYIDLWSIGGGEPWYMCILLYLKLIWCSGIPQIHGQLEEGTMVYLHFAICETYLVQWYFIDPWSIGGGGLGICVFCYM